MTFEINVPDETKVLIISDLHLTQHFDQKKYDLLYKLVSECDQLVINGDLWTYYSCVVDSFLGSRWAELFPLFREKNCLYILGNHDRARWTGNKLNSLCLWKGNKAVLRFNKVTLKIEHGHKISKLDSTHNEAFVWADRFFKVDIVGDYLQKALIDLLGVEYYCGLGKKLNKIQKRRVGGNSEGKEYLVVGHTHSPEIDHEVGYINSGFIHYGYASYITVQNSHVTLHKTSY
ncbi:MAG: hypothetical protein COW24_00110 [Candidatus Kerfeldbacteria bacterium CG15_BIG_FIL_POST_REV_8_21_14_020_45_12]|uniref:Calcineurin-like phosphoesterase domain-containing protein n=1 Tax=Candidatus Kerfeldbacteria bacterium CG15_BIG_FIL_POST_REV_8_21_14_020_45_12 TaxID=2014247 RepID=A0A2M7H5E4_9BACT|nr:MAG: hypothetical protein COW24_00110 [Candidatus Kerfeldbacteria bacterium CG15_BIG_FIL_POST_REV_8_21_14_020_45_12]